MEKLEELPGRSWMKWVYESGRNSVSKLKVDSAETIPSDTWHVELPADDVERLSSIILRNADNYHRISKRNYPANYVLEGFLQGVAAGIENVDASIGIIYNTGVDIKRHRIAPSEDILHLCRKEEFYLKRGYLEIEEDVSVEGYYKLHKKTLKTAKTWIERNMLNTATTQRRHTQDGLIFETHPCDHVYKTKPAKTSQLSTTKNLKQKTSCRNKRNFSGIIAYESQLRTKPRAVDVPVRGYAKPNGSRCL